MGNLGKSSPLKIIAAFFIVAIIGILLTVKLADGSTAAGIIGGLVTLGLSFASATIVNKWL